MTVADWYLGPAPPRRRPAWWLDDRPRTTRRAEPATVDTKIRSDASGQSVMFGHFAVYDQWAEINSKVEGHFLERFKRGALSNTIRHDRREIRSLFQHGTDAVVGLKP